MPKQPSRTVAKKPRPAARSKAAAKPRLLVFIVAYNAEKTIQWVLKRIPEGLLDTYAVEVLIIDDASKDATFEKARETVAAAELPFPLHVLYNPVNQGYGGNQKIGYRYAIDHGFDIVALVHGDGQYAPECLGDLAEPLRKGEADAVFGSRMMEKGGALQGGMPLYKYVGNKVLSWYENRMLRTDFTEFHSGYRLYSVAALKKVPFHLNTDVFHFDTEIIIQFVIAGLKIKELPIPTYYGDEICNVDGLKYAKDVFIAVLKARMQELSLFYDRKYDCADVERSNAHYGAKFGFSSTHTAVLEAIPAGSRVLDLGCGDGGLGLALKEKGCHVVGIDANPLPKGVSLDGFHRHNLNKLPLPVEPSDFDYVLILDVIEHLAAPEDFVTYLRSFADTSPNVTFVVTTANVAFGITRLMLLIGSFNYGKRGVLDLTHSRLFTFNTLRRLFQQAGFDMLEQKGIPAPFPLALGDTGLAKLLLRLNGAMIKLSKGFFSYQIYMTAKPRPTLPLLLKNAIEKSAERAAKGHR